MTISRKLAARTEWKCDQCGQPFIWGEDCWAGGSLLLQEESPEDVPTLCSTECKDKFIEREKSGEVVIPTVRQYGYRVKITENRKGY